MDVNFELYKVFYYVAKHLSFSEASKELFISQSAVSQNIQALEKKLGISLFIRNTKKVLLTNEGRLLFNHIEPAINMINNGYMSLLEVNNLSKGKLHIGASDTICRYYLIPFLKRFNQKYPNIHLQVTNRTSYVCVDLLRQGVVDLIVTNLPNNEIDETMTVLPVKEFNDIFVGNHTFSYLKNKKLSYRELTQLPIMMLEKNTTTSVFLYNYFERRGLQLMPTIELGSIDLLVELARIGLGIAYIPEFCLKGDQSELFKLELLEQIPPRQLAIVTSKKIPLSLSSQKFIEMVHHTNK